MKISIVGSGKVGSALFGRLVAAGHDVRYGARTDRDNSMPIAAAATWADVVIVATPAKAVLEILHEIAPHMADKILIDAVNSVSFAIDGYATSTHAFQALLPSTHIAKCFNTVGYETMADPTYGDERADMFMAGDSAEAKVVAHQLALDCGFAECHDVGGSNRYVALENMAIIWISLAMGQGKGRSFAWKLLKR
jgi:predicted dinucleotide-binding enzyme